MKNPGNVFVLSSPSGGGKSSIIRRVLKRVPRLTLSTSHTSRPPRPGEKDGREYHFVSRPRFLEMQRNGDFAESVRLHRHHYGTSRHELDRLMAGGKDILLDIDVRGAKNVLKLYPAPSWSSFFPLHSTSWRSGSGGGDRKTKVRSRPASPPPPGK